MFALRRFFVFVLLWFVQGAHAAREFAGTPPLPTKEPQEERFLPERLSVADEVVKDAVEHKNVPGAVLLIARDGNVVLRKAYGFAGARPQTRAMREDTVFDLASLTKLFTATAAMRLLEEGKIALDAPVANYLPAFKNVADATGERAQITIRHLMTHSAGFPAGGAYAGKTRTVAQITEEIAASPHKYAPGTQFLYSDFSFITLGAVIEAVSGQTLDAYCHDIIFAPLGMKDTAFRPQGELAQRAASTSPDADLPELRGKVHDPTAAALNGVAGSAGIFSTADDLAKFCQMFLNGGEYGGARILKPETVALMTSKQSPFAGSARGLGFDLDSPYSIRGALPPGSFGHTGFTGTSLWIDPLTKSFIVLLANGVHGKPPVVLTPLRRMVSSIVAASFADLSLGPGRLSSTLPKSLEESVQVQTGLDVLMAENFKRLEGKKVGIVCNHTAVDRKGNHLVDSVFANKNVSIVALFSPEHGIRGALDESIKSSTDEKTGLKIYSLYDTGLTPETRYRATPEMLTGIDTLVFDVQDIGVRYYTYISTLGYLLESAAKNKIKVLVLDRPNPLGGLTVEGPLLNAESASFIGYHTMPISHGMTIGELALMFNAERKIGADIEVVKMPNWNRRLLFDQTGMTWVNPSPNIRNVRQAAIYPGVGILEGMPISVGRGTDAPFEVIGAPWMDGVALAENLNARRLAGVSFAPTRFTPVSSKFKNEECSGVQIMLWDRRLCRPTELGIHLADALARLFPEKMDAKTLEIMHRWIGNKTIPAQIAQGTPPEEIIASWSKDVDAWLARRKAFLLYS